MSKEEKEKDRVNGAGYISDDSAFYGDEAQQAKLQAMADTFDARAFWAAYPGLFSTMAELERRKHLELLALPDDISKEDVLPSPVAPEPMRHENHTSSKIMTFPDVAGNPQNIFNAFLDLAQPSSSLRIDGRAPNESVDAFLKRVNPLNPPPLAPWIWIHNPNGSLYDSDEATFVARGQALLAAYALTDTRIHTENPGKPKGFITRKLTPHRTQLKNDILTLACSTRLTSGKWMLFPPESDVPRTWRLVCEAVDQNRLGPTAKIATDTGGASGPPGRLICIYTRDFSDAADVRRVLEELVEVGVVKRDKAKAARGIYYKCDAFTLLGINSGNDYGMPASLYSSRDVLNGSTNGGGAASSSSSSKTAPQKRKADETGVQAVAAAKNEKGTKQAKMADGVLSWA